MAYRQEEVVQEAEKISKINSAGLINLRINNLWVDANRHSRQGDYIRWDKDLDRVWCELGGDVKEGSKEQQEYHLMSKEISEKLDKLPKSQDPFSTVTKKDKEILNEVYAVLIKKEIFLRRLQNIQGKGTAYMDEEDQWE